MKYSRIVRAFLSTPWAIVPEKLMQIGAFLELAASGAKFTAEEVESRITPVRERKVAEAKGGVAVIPMVGMITQRGANMEEVSGPMGVATERISRLLRMALADQEVKAVILDVDSPGGTVSGVEELSREIFDARGGKPIVAVANSLAASAAYWIASAADELVITPGGEVGSIGVWAAHVDQSKWMEMEGLSPTVISAGKFKVETHPWLPLSDEAKAHLQDEVDHFYQMFVAAVARNRAVSEKRVQDEFGEGLIVPAEKAVKFGMADRLATLRETIERFGVSAAPSRQASQAAVQPLGRMRRELRYQEIVHP